ncbi:hypothetical protein EDB84DRAFT_1571047 [Lactarius hengduanensis]|nr:hypothetical protein EDB84DRAFT_1571047 [Lactarius hengduanensis]
MGLFYATPSQRNHVIPCKYFPGVSRHHKPSPREPGRLPNVTVFDAGEKKHRYVHLKVRSAATLSASTYASAKPPNPATPAPRDALSFDTAGEGRLLQDIVDEALAQGVWITRTRRLRGQEFVEAYPSIRLATTTAWQQRKDDQDCSGATKTIKNHGGNDDEDNQDDHGGSDDDVKTMTAAAMTAKSIKSAIATRRQSRATAAAATMRSQSRWQRRREDDHGGGDDGDDQDGGGVGDSGSDEGGGREGDVDGIGY